MEPTAPPSPAERAAGRGRAPLHRLRRTVRGALLRGAARVAPDGSAPLPALRSCRRILLVSVNQRLGNTLLATAPVGALVKALPEAELDFVGGPLAPAVLAGLASDACSSWSAPTRGSRGACSA